MLSMINQANDPEDAIRRKPVINKFRAILSLLVLAGVTVVVLVLLAFCFPAGSGRELPWIRKKHIAMCIDEQRQLVIVAQMYAQDNNGKLMNQKYWHGDFSSAWAQAVCPSAPKEYPPRSYGFNAALSEKPLKSIANPATIIMFADSRNDLFSPQDIDITRHGNGFVAAFADGHCAFLSAPAAVRVNNDLAE